MEVDEICSVPAFLSTSLSTETLYMQRPTRIQIYIPKGTKAIYMDGLFQPHEEEVEVLLPPNTPLHVISKKEENGTTWIKAIISNEKPL
jgi:hypothetical protein